ncbi:winged helix-turn-helix domain-containing protein [Alicyclobacillus vulcanalis]|uniref:DNA-binding response regulator, OmpR family, contains REC and winged-helix (WHTH) domain n=1 Tax=Alicyclobacillus vulcanalis TaxID=252246 RepID=A0A1N7P0K0_9BACL|nr:winged helix-turn-helix domain-containing protein [Alicyclobacillus vulcanalis]SIT04165.1 DNA-binding response regulator, OmpR family, contains REC and winged-helix (wHTH) domain [Alicyclobacillus vulcanalis]
MRIILCTDDTCLVRMLSVILEACDLRICRTVERATAISLASSEDIFIDGIASCSEAFWAMVASSPRANRHYVMIRSPLTENDWMYARSLGLSGFLTDPLVALQTFIGGDLETFVRRFSVPEGFPSLPIASVNVGRGVRYKCGEQCLMIGHRRVPLSQMESRLLELFLDHEGEVLTRGAIANALWEGHVNPKGIAKLVSRLRQKLGPAGDLVQGRRQGGYVYRRVTEL